MLKILLLSELRVSASRAAACTVIPIIPRDLPRHPRQPDLSPSPPASFFMVEDKYVGLALAVSGTVAIGSSFIITKKVRNILLLSDDHHLYITQGLNEAGDRGNSYSQASDDHAYLKNPVWWVGMAISERCHTCVLHPLISL
jgi:hypothetical protein